MLMMCQVQIEYKYFLLNLPKFLAVIGVFLPENYLIKMTKNIIYIFITDWIGLSKK